MKKFLLVLSVISIMPNAARAIWSWNNNSAIARSRGISVAGNRHSQSFYAVKKEMLSDIYYDHRRTLYCDAEFTRNKQILPPKGFNLPNLQKVDFDVHNIQAEELERRAARMEWEHIVPAQNFGKTFPEWSKGHPKCKSNKGKSFKGRSCAEQESEDFRYMYTDMYNLYPSIGAVNYLRANYNFTQFSGRKKPTFGACGGMRISDNKVEPRNEVKGLIARTYFYMQATYPRYSIGKPMATVLKAWDKQYPVSRWECVRAYRIEKLQGNANAIVKQRCEDRGWYNEGKDAEKHMKLHRLTPVVSF